MKTNESILNEIKEAGYITEQQVNLLKKRSNNIKKDLFNYDIFPDGIPVTSEQGAKGLEWLRRSAQKKMYGYRELDIVNNATCEDLTFKGFYNCGNMYVTNFQPIYDVNGMEYTVKGGQIYIVG
jgi:hypothetical protein